MYSAINNIVNNDLAYSVLYPDTSSLSPSARSKGVRFNSAKTLTIHINIPKGIITPLRYVLISLRLKEL